MPIAVNRELPGTSACLEWVLPRRCAQVRPRMQGQSARPFVPKPRDKPAVKRTRGVSAVAWWPGGRQSPKAAGAPPPLSPLRLLAWATASTSEMAMPAACARQECKQGAQERLVAYAWCHWPRKEVELKQGEARVLTSL